MSNKETQKADGFKGLPVARSVNNKTVVGATQSGPQPRTPLMPTHKHTHPRYVVGIGSSAGGVEALMVLLRSIPKDTENAYVIIQHMSPSFKTTLPEILTRQSEHTVVLATEGALLQANCFYLIPPDKMLTVFHGRLLLEDRSTSVAPCYFPIDYFLSSLAKDCGSRAVALILSGTGSDGSIGIQAVKKNDGFVIVQSPESSKFSGMPKNAIATKVVNSILPLEGIARAIDEFTTGIVGASIEKPVLPSSNSTALDRIFFTLRNNFDIDFSSYQEELVVRRIDRRVKITSCATVEAYSGLVAKNNKELNALYDDLLLGVTEFNRHPESLEKLREIVFPRLLEAGKTKGVVRVWVVGCSTGEEAFTLAFMLDEYLQETSSGLDFKIFATDVYEKSLKIASRAVYPEGRLEELPEQWREKYFNIQGGQASIKTSIRERVVFASHNVIKDPPFPMVDLITCRNLIIYLKKQAKIKAMESFQFSLKNQGSLLIGPKDGMPTEKEVDFKQLCEDTKIYQCIRPGRSFTGKIAANKEKAKAIVKKQPTPAISDQISEKKNQESAFISTLQSKVLQSHGPAAIIFNKNLIVEYYYGEVRQYCAPFSGKASHDLVDILPDNLFSIVSSIMPSITLDSPEASESLVVSDKSEKHELLLVSVARLDLEKDGAELYIVKFATREVAASGDEVKLAMPAAIQAKAQLLKERLKNSTKELLDSKTEMATIVGQLEASNEELQSTNEELQAGSEELQSTNEELQAVNEELYTVNAECQMRITELSEMSSDVQNIYDISEIGTLFVDNNLRIRKYNSFTQKIFNLLPDDLGRPLEHFSSTLKVDFTKKVKNVLKSVKLFQREIVSVDNVTYLMRIAPYRTDDFHVKGAVLVFMDISSLKKTQTQLTEVRDELTHLRQETSDLIVKFDGNGKISWANENYDNYFASSEGESGENTGESAFFECVHPDDMKISLKCLEELKKSKAKEKSVKFKHNTLNGDMLEILWHIKPKFDKRGAVSQFISIGQIAN